jgi:hypothetical protein
MTPRGALDGRQPRRRPKGLQIGRNRIEDRAQIGADEAESRDGGNRNQRRDQTVLNRGRAAFVMNELGEDGHLIYFLVIQEG